MASSRHAGPAGPCLSGGCASARHQGERTSASRQTCCPLRFPRCAGSSGVSSGQGRPTPVASSLGRTGDDDTSSAPDDHTGPAEPELINPGCSTRRPRLRRRAPRPFRALWTLSDPNDGGGSHPQRGRARSWGQRGGPLSARARPAAEPRRVGLPIAPHPRGSLSSTLERVPELLDLLWGQLLAAAHKAQHLFALDLSLSFTGGLRFHALAIGLGVEEPRQEFEARIGGGGVARENRRDDQKGLQGAAPSVSAWPARARSQLWRSGSTL